MNIPNENHTNNHNDNRRNKPIDSVELEKSKAHIVVEIIEYVPNPVVSKTIIKKSTGNITVSSFDAGEELAEKLSPYDNYIQVIDGTAELVMNGKKINLKLGGRDYYSRECKT